MEGIIPGTLALLVLAMGVALAARRLSLPYTVGLALTGLLAAFLPFEKGQGLTPGLIYEVILPALLFEGALNLDWAAVRRDWPPIAVLTVFGVLISAAVAAAGTYWLLHWPLQAAAMFGVLIAATDPISVIATFKDNRLAGRLPLLVEAESLFNDGVAAVMFSVALIWVTGGASTPAVAGVTLLREGGGGLVAGAICGLAGMLAARRSDDHLVETTITLIAAYGAFLLAESLGASGVLATVAAGLLIGNVRRESRLGNWVSERGRVFLHEVWELIAFIANSIIFILIGVSSAQRALGGDTALEIGAAILLVLAGRALSVYPLCALFAGTRWAVPIRDQHVMWWAGLRGALGLALALLLPGDMPGRDQVVTATFGVAAFSIIVQGVTMPVLLRRLKIVPSRVT